MGRREIRALDLALDWDQAMSTSGMISAETEIMRGIATTKRTTARTRVTAAVEATMTAERTTEEAATG